MTTAGQQADRPTDIRALTGLRIVAACWVMLLHLQLFSGPYLDQLPLLRSLVGAGWTGVELFFVLSGFVITVGYVDRIGPRPTLPAVGRFLINRFARIWPAWAVVTVLAGAWIWSLRAAGLDADVLGPHPAADVPNMLRQLTMTQMWGYSSLSGASYVPPGWSISAEWTAYLACPLVILLLRRLRRAHPALLVTAAVAVMAPLSVDAFINGTPDFEQNWVVRIVCGFSAGMLMALAFLRLRPHGARLEQAALGTVWTCVFLILAGASWASWAAWGAGPGELHVYSGVIVVVFPLLVLALSFTDRGPSRWLASRPMVYGGRLSYCLYLVHFFILEIVLTLWWQDPAARNVVTPGLVLAVPGIVLACFLACAALHHGVEEPARRVLLRSLTHLRPPEGAVPAPRRLRAARGSGAGATDSVRPHPDRRPVAASTATDASAEPPRAASRSRAEPLRPPATLLRNVGSSA